MITLKINLLNLKCSVKKMNSKSGEMECIVIPIDLNRLFRGEKGIYLDMVGFEIRNPKEGSKDTHIIKQGLSKDDREAMSEEEQKAMPILGNLAILSGERESVSSPVAQEESDDLPF